MQLPIFTIGHSDHSYDEFLSLIQAHDITAVADVRSSPYSRRSPHFNREILKGELLSDKISYVFLGEELGGRPKEKSLYRKGAANYEAMAELPAFKSGIDRLVKGLERHRIALMCSENHPLDCHRCLLVGRTLSELALDVVHIFPDGKTSKHLALEEELLDLVLDPRLKDSVPKYIRLREAYRKQAERVAFHEPAQPAQSTLGLL